MNDQRSPSSVALEEISRLLHEFEEKITDGTRDPDHFLTITEIEAAWGRLLGDTNILYSKMLQSMLHQVNEKEMIRQKKRTPGRRN